MLPNAKPSELTAVLAVMDPKSVSASTVVSAYVPVANFHSLRALLLTGVLGTSATVDAKLVQAKDTSGTSAKDITGKAITQLVKASNDNNQAVINLRGDELDTEGGFTHVALSVTVGTAASIVAATLEGYNPRFAPASASNAATVVQVV